MGRQGCALQGVATCGVRSTADVAVVVVHGEWIKCGSGSGSAARRGAGLRGSKPQMNSKPQTHLALRLKGHPMLQMAAAVVSTAVGGMHTFVQGVTHKYWKAQFFSANSVALAAPNSCCPAIQAPLQGASCTLPSPFSPRPWGRMVGPRQGEMAARELPQYSSPLPPLRRKGPHPTWQLLISSTGP